ncbi:MAG: hypothetical protein SVS85_02515, partial [Candidatus Nanohaloarchaea archaeon]|nr:hypothetical protein [Candidatus Nanohaloarchaea archaeon]
MTVTCLVPLRMLYLRRSLTETYLTGFWIDCGNLIAPVDILYRLPLQVVVVQDQNLFVAGNRCHPLEEYGSLFPSDLSHYNVVR